MKRKPITILLVSTVLLSCLGTAAWADEGDPASDYSLDAFLHSNEVVIRGKAEASQGPADAPPTWLMPPSEHVLDGGGRVRVFMSVREKEECLNTIGGDPQGICLNRPGFCS